MTIGAVPDVLGKIMNGVFPYDQSKPIRVQPIVLGAITSIILLGTFLVDIGAPDGMATWVPYCIAIVLALQWRGAATIVPVTAAALILMVVGFLLRPLGDFQTETTNRAIGAATVTALALACLYIDWRRHKQRKALATTASRLNRLRFFVNRLKRAAVVLSDSRGRVTEWNQSAQHLTGYSIEQMIGRPVFRIFQRREIGTVRWAQAYRKARTEERAVYEAVCPRSNGSLCHVSIVIKPIRNQAGSLQGYSLAIQKYGEHRDKTSMSHG
ncbi:MAG: PAS domain-containing protein [Nitrospira sp.]|jgi:PAS domain S-box-containing protein|nr:PAS domain-containing protein [Nitrospira sp. BO4]